MKYQVIIIGGGPAGYTAAESAGKAGLSVLLIEKNNQLYDREKEEKIKELKEEYQKALEKQ